VFSTLWEGKAISASVYDFMGETYARSRREAHRRRATLLSPPTVSLCACIERPGDWQNTFERFLRAIVDYAQDPAANGQARSRADAFVKNVVRHYDVSNASNTPNASTDLTFEIPDSVFRDALWRIEVLRDYVAVTLHVGIELGRSETDYLVTIRGTAPGTTAAGQQADKVFRCGFERSGPTNREAAVGLNKVLFNDLSEELEKRFRPIMSAVRPIHTEVNGTALEDVVFALTYSVLAPWTVLADADPRPDVRAGLALAEPAFPEFDAPGFRPQELAAALQSTNRFLTQHWEVLKGSLLSDQESDCVACYMQNGHCIYVSSLGSETANPREPVKYLLLYRDPASPPDGKRGISHAAPCNFAWRLSRFVGRLHDIAAARLRALSQHEEISRFLVHAKDLEFRLAERTLTSEQAVKEIETRFRMITHARTRDVPAGEGFTDDDYEREKIVPNTKPLIVRAGIVQAQYAIVQRLCIDLGIINLPGYQPYDQFLRRRVVGPIEWMLTAPDLYGSIARKLNDAYVRLQRQDTVERTRKIAAQSDAIVKFQRAADGLGKLLFVYYGMQSVYYAIDHAKKAEHWPKILKPLPGFFAHLDARASALTVGVVIAILCFALFLGELWERGFRARERKS